MGSFTLIHAKTHAMKIPYRIPPTMVAREELLTTYKVDLPIEGGWGYDIDDAVVINKSHPSVNPGLPFHGVSVERTFVLHRLYIELISLRPQDDDYSGISWELVSQRLIHRNGRSYDQLLCDASALHTRDFETLKAIWTGPNGHGSPGFDEESHLRMHKQKLVHFECEYWFDVTSFI